MDNNLMIPLDYAPLHKNRFLVSLGDEKNYGLSIYDIVSFDENEKRIYLTVRINDKNINILSYVEKVKHKWLPKFLINKNHFTDIYLELLTALNNRAGMITYKDCVLRKVCYPNYSYSCDGVISITLEFSYGKKELTVCEVTNERVPVSFSLPKTVCADSNKCETKNNLKEKLESKKKCLVNSNQMLSENLKVDDKVIIPKIKKHIKKAIADNSKEINEINELLEH